jgi:hypothetical protein
MVWKWFGNGLEMASQRVVLPDASALAPQPPPISLGLPSLPDRQAFRLNASF